MLELILRVYFVLSALPVLGFVIVLLVDVTSTSMKRRREAQHARAVSHATPRS
jgi:hypothetical protein